MIVTTGKPDWFSKAVFAETVQFGPPERFANGPRRPLASRRRDRRPEIDETDVSPARAS